MLTDANADPAPRDSVLSKLCLQYLLLVRVVVIFGQLAAAIAAYYILATPPSILPVAIVIIALGGFTFFSWRTLQSGTPVSERSILTQLLVDVLGLAVLLLFTGGSANPFASLLLLPVIVAAALLPRRYTWIIAAEAALFYTGLLFVHVHPLFVEVHPPESTQIEHEFTFHVWGMWLGFLFSAMVVAYFVARMGSTLRQHDRDLAQAREKALEAGQLAALGSLAAGTAHELGTPLATIAILAKELEHDYEDNETLTEKLQLLRSQVMRCKGILSSMAARSGAAQADAGRPVYLDRYLDELIGEWRDLHPGLAPRVKRSGPQPAAQIIADRTLTQALLNVLNNAADAATQTVAVEAIWTDDRLEITVSDDGVGLPETLREHIGKPFVTTKPAGKGLGLGLYLARTTLDRLGGTLDLQERRPSGVCVRIGLPLTPLMTAKPL